MDPKQIPPLRVEGFGWVNYPEGITPQEADRLAHEADAAREAQEQE